MYDMIEELAPRKPSQETLQSLPFTYHRTFDQSQAAYLERRFSLVQVNGAEVNAKTDAEILQIAQEGRENKDWFVSKYWRSKGQPSEAVEFTLNGQQITLYNYGKEKPFTVGHIMQAEKVFQEFTSRFPQILEQIRWILIDDQQPLSAFGDSEKYPINGQAQSHWKAFKLYPRGIGLFPFRVLGISNFEGVLIHELTHLIQGEFEKEWWEKFQWEFCIEHRDEWEWRPTPDVTFDGLNRRPYNKKTNAMAPNFCFPLQPDQCVSDYAKIDWNEDVCECMVAYICNPELLRRISPDKFSILQKHDVKQARPNVSWQRIPQGQIKLPEIKTEVVYYYIEEGNPWKTP